MQAGVGLLILDVMPIYRSLPRYRHDYLKFYQLPNSKRFPPLAASSSSLRGTTTQVIYDTSRSISGAVAGEASSSSTRFPITNLISPHLHYLPFASRFPLPHFTNLPFYSPLFFVRRFLARSVFA